MLKLSIHFEFTFQIDKGPIYRYENFWENYTYKIVL